MMNPLEMLARAYKIAYREVFGVEYSTNECILIPVKTVYETAKRLGIIPSNMTFSDFDRLCRELAEKYPNKVEYHIHPYYIDNPEVGASICIKRRN